MKKKNLSLVMFTLLLGAGLVVAGRTNLSQEVDNNEFEAEQVGEVSLALDYGDGEISTYSGIASGVTVLAALEQVAVEKGIVLETKDYDFGVFVEAIGGQESTEEMAWIYFINGESADVGADAKMTEAGDYIEWRYIKPSW